jgi:predicted RNA-binding protein with PUA-like domain
MPAKIPPPPSTGFWLLKSEPEAYSIDQFAKDKTTLWTGVRNYLARNLMTESMKPGDKFFFYHSNAEPTAIVGLGEVVRPGVPDPTAFDKKSEYFDPKSSKSAPTWTCAEVKFLKKFSRVLTLDELRGFPELAGLPLLAKGQRLSVQQASAKDFAFILDRLK